MISTRTFIYFLVLTLSQMLFAQTYYVRGYVINNEGERIECYLLNKDWKNSPSEFKFKRIGVDTEEVGTLNNVSEFGIPGKFKFVKAKVKLENSERDGPFENPVFRESTIFIRVLIEGKLGLFHYADSGRDWFFYSSEEFGLEPLIYKTYLVGGRFSKLEENNQFRDQLKILLDCENIEDKYLSNLKYQEDDLLEAFVKYHDCLEIPFKGWNNSDIKFGQVSFGELEMDTYPQDSSAGAVVLYDKGVIQGSDGIFQRHRRIKILKKSGLGQGNIVLNVPSKGSIKAMIFNLENGNIIEQKVKSSDIYEEEIFDGFYVYKLFLPNVRVGSIIDLKYFYFGVPFEWHFQELIPVKHSELILEPSPYLYYKKIKRGNVRVREVQRNRFLAEYVPAFVIEPFTDHYTNYLTKFEFELEKIVHPRIILNVSENWNVVDSRMLDHSRFGEVFNTSSFLNEKAKEIKNSGMSLEEKIYSAYNYIKDQIKWNGIESVYASKWYGDSFKNHQGNSADINLILISLLRKVGIKAYPVVLSTRENGLLNAFYPTVWKLNYVVAYVEDIDYRILLDATDESLSPGIVPLRCLNGPGRLIKEDGQGKWLSLDSSEGSQEKQLIQIKMDDSDVFTASISTLKTGQYYLKWANEIDEIGSHENYASGIEEKLNLGIIDFAVTKDDPTSFKSMESISADVRNYVQYIENDIIINPFFFSSISSNPFKAKERLTPIDLAFRSKKSSTIKIQIPQGYSAIDFPQSGLMRLSNDGASFEFRCNVVGQFVLITYSLNVDRIRYSNDDYQELRNLFDLINEKLNKAIVLRKI